MNRSNDPLFDSRIADWLEEDPNHAPDQALSTILAAVPSISQRRRLAVPWRFNVMSNTMRLAGAAIVGVLAVGVIYLSLPRSDGVGGSPTPSPSPTGGPSATPALTPGVLTSTRYGYTLAYPAGIHALPSTEDWPAERTVSADSKFLDRFSGRLDLSSPTMVTWFTGIASQPLPDGMSGDTWMTGYIQRNWAAYGDTCGGRPEDWVATTVAGVTGRQVQSDCGSGPKTITEIVFATADTGWVITGDTPLVAVLRAEFQLPG